MSLVFSNNATSLLASSINNSATSVVITSGDEGNFPSISGSDWFPITVVDASGNMEIMKVTARSGVTLTVERGQEGTSAIAFEAGARVDVRLTAAALVAILARENHSGSQAQSTVTGLETALATLTAAVAARLTIANGAANSIVGRSGTTSGDRVDIQAGSNDTLLRRVGDALGFGQLTIGMFPDSLVTFAKMATAALATATEYAAATASKILTAEKVWEAAETVNLTDGTNIAVNFATGINFGGTSSGRLLLGGDRNLSEPTNIKDGQTGRLVFGATGATRTLTPNAAWLLADGVEAGPWQVTTAQTLVICYHCIGSAVWITGVLRRG